MTTKKQKTKLTVVAGNAKYKLEDDIDGVFKLPLVEFIAARKALATRLKKEGRADEAARVNGLTKPSVSAWTVNQLYWRHREPFDRLMHSGQKFRQAQTSSKAGKITDMRDALDTRRETLTELSDLATEVLSEAGHNPSLDTIRRIATTLEAMSAYASLPEGMASGRLTTDVDPPGFDSLASFVPVANPTKRPAQPAKIVEKPRTQSPEKSTAAADANKSKAARQAKMADAKAHLQEAKRALTEAKAKAQRLKAEQKKADAVVNETEKQKRDAERRFKAASTALAEASVRAQNIKAETERAAKALVEAARAVDSAAKELESLFGQK